MKETLDHPTMKLKGVINVPSVTQFLLDLKKGSKASINEYILQQLPKGPGVGSRVVPKTPDKKKKEKLVVPSPSPSQTLSSAEYGNQFLNDNVDISMNDIFQDLVETETKSMVDVPIQEENPDPPADDDKDIQNRRQKDTDASSSNKDKDQTESSKKDKDLSVTSKNKKYMDVEELIQTDDVVDAEELTQDDIDRPNLEEGRFHNDMIQPLPLQGPFGKKTIPFDYFFNKDLEYLKYGNKEKQYDISLTKQKATRYELEGIEKMIPQLWSSSKVAYDKNVALGIHHWGPKRQLYYTLKNVVTSAHKKSIMELYMMNRQHGRMILESVENGPLIWPTIEENGVTRPRKYPELTLAEATQANFDVKATNIILKGLPPKVYALVSNHKVAKELWERIQLLMQGTSLRK
nr:hypothetical protein [Tanacetum cinerariifolium]